MSRVNVGSSAYTGAVTHEGGPARNLTAEQELRRTVLACLLWEDTFYESGKSVAQRIADLVPQVPAEHVAALAVEARSTMHLRHAPLLLVREMARHKTHTPYVRATLGSVIQRADELAEFLAIYWKDKKDAPLASSVKRGLADAFTKFSAYDLAKYNRDNPVKLRDVLFLVHPKPKDFLLAPEVAGATKHRGPVLRHGEGQAGVWKQLVDGTLASPDTWEVALSSAGKNADKQAIWTRLLSEKRLGPLALLRNLRNMTEAGVDDSTIRLALTSMTPDRVLPFRFVAAQRIMPQFTDELEQCMYKNLDGQSKIPGVTYMLVDVSGSMDDPLSSKSDMKRVDAATGLSVFAREICQTVRVFTFSDRVVEVPNYRGFALVNAIQQSQPHGGTYLGKAVEFMNGHTFDRLIVITDEQSHDRVPGPNGRGYVINVASHKPGVGYGPWQHIDGWSDRVLDYIRAVEAPAR